MSTEITATSCRGLGEDRKNRSVRRPESEDRQSKHESLNEFANKSKESIEKVEFCKIPKLEELPMG